MGHNPEITVGDNPEVAVDDNPEVSVDSCEINIAVESFVYSSLYQVLLHLFASCLRNLLHKLDLTLQKASRKDWPNVCFALCMIIFAVESMEVDIHLHEQNPYLCCQKDRKKCCERPRSHILAELCKRRPTLH